MKRSDGMKVKGSRFLQQSKPLLKKLLQLLSAEYEYVSILGTDVKGTSYQVSKTTVDINDYWLTERGFVIRIYNGRYYSEYSFNELSEDKMDEILQNIKNNLGTSYENVSANVYSLIEEEELNESFFGDIELDPVEVGSKKIIEDLTNLRDLTLNVANEISNTFVYYGYLHISKIFISNKKELEQSYILSEAYVSPLAQRNDKIKRHMESTSGMKGYEVVEGLNELYTKAAHTAVALLDATTVKAGEYDVICHPEITGLIAHEAFGHGVEMDMFVKNRAKGAEYIGKSVASEKTTMQDGAKSLHSICSYLFDDEGTIGTDTVIVKNGILQTGISDLLSAMKLGSRPTGNGRRESYERKAYTRMTNTFFAAGEDSYEDMIASISYGYQLEGMYSGMEDPKNWGIQCIAALGREIVDGKFTGKLISPVLMTGYVPDLLGSFSMLSKEIGVVGVGYCGKGYKEFVKTADGGPYVKAKVRLG